MIRGVPPALITLCALAAADISVSGGPWRWRESEAAVVGGAWRAQMGGLRDSLPPAARTRGGTGGRDLP